MSDLVTLPAFPGPLRWMNDAVAWSVMGADGLTITAGPRTDLFTDPGGDYRTANAPALLGRIDGDFMLSARVRLDLASTFDAGALVLHADAEHWAKLALERSPQGDATIVSVVTRGVSDDCNSFAVEDEDVRLRISRIGAAFAFHASTGGGSWRLVRYFALDGSPEVGFLAQTPLDERRAIQFEQIRYEAVRLADLRDGS
jgi:regulation of enolase protein 1 (concanavalin A-like superfamily)